MERQTDQRGQEGGERDGQDINIIVLWFHGKTSLILKTDVASRSINGKRTVVVQMLTVIATSDPRMCTRAGFCLSLHPQKSAIVWAAGRIMMVSAAI